MNMNDEHDMCVECLKSADRFHDDVDCMNCGCKGCPWLHNCSGQCYTSNQRDTVVNKI